MVSRGLRRQGCSGHRSRSLECQVVARFWQLKEERGDKPSSAVRQNWVDAQCLFAVWTHQRPLLLHLYPGPGPCIL